MQTHNIKTDSLKEIKQNIQKYSPHPNQVKIIAVTKNFNYNSIISAIKNNIPCIGENKVKEFLEKKQKNQNNRFNVETHLIGHLQSNKVNKAVGNFDVIQTIDSLKIAEKINKKAKQLGIKQRVFIQINVGNDPKKYGFLIKDIYNQIESISKKNNLKLEGLMTILPLDQKAEKSQTLFNKMYKIQTKVTKEIHTGCKFLSMGMSGDYIYALKEGATHIRIGTKLYGNRQ